MTADETTEFWMEFPVHDLAARCAILHSQRREMQGQHAVIEIEAVRRTLSSVWIKGSGIEVGAGSRPFFLPAGATCYYGDIRDKAALDHYFNGLDVAVNGYIDAQTMAGIKDASLDFVISAHVIEHLFNPVGSIKNAIRVLRKSGIFLLVVPEKSKTWDRDRPVTTIQHMIADAADGGATTKLQAYLEHVEYVHPVMTGQHIPTAEVQEAARRIMDAQMDIHVHSWTHREFRQLLDYCAEKFRFRVVHSQAVQNENIFVLQRY
ncbi:MAG: methyltransferase domain-containing protein [Pseudomonadota bacterium]|uniref:methyltransferase domain-containing protein n=1 Tax=Sphingobium naphthae TaxID=1886786 RepID=UPI002B0D05DE|nr:methyltransferase domain-containing protein [Pseudomonadota bacterium]